MKATVTVKKEVEVKFVKVHAGARYWEDSTVNGVEDTNGKLIPFREGDYWCPVIDIDSGKIIGWPQGTTAEIHYKVCDDGSYYLLDADGNTVLSIEDNYVPNCLIPGEDGDYIIMSIDETGLIEEWSPSFIDFEDSCDDD